MSSANLRTDIALARHELKQTRAERDALRRRVERVLGDEIRATDRQELIDHIDELEDMLRSNQASHISNVAATRDLTERCSDLVEQLDAARQLNQTLVRQHNRSLD